MNKKIKVSLVRNPMGAVSTEPDYTITGMTNVLVLEVPGDKDVFKLRSVHVGDRINERQAQDIVDRVIIDTVITPA